MEAETVAVTPKRRGRKPSRDTVTVSRAELNALIAQSVQAAVTSKASGGTDVAVAEMFAAAMKPVLEQQGEKGQELAKLLMAQQPFRSLELLQTDRKSHYNPLGERDFPRPKLVDAIGKPRKTFFCGSNLSDFQETMTREEIEALNAIQNDCEIDKPGGKWMARIRKDGSSEELHITLPMGNKDVYLHYPPMLQILQELRLGKKLVDVNSLLAMMIAHSMDPEAFVSAVKRLGETAAA